MAYAERYFTPNQFQIDGNGAPYVGSQLFFYVTGTTTPLNTYSDAALTVPNTNPIVADENGNFGSIWLGNTQAYKIAFYSPIPAGANQSDSTPSSPLGTNIWTEDPCGPAASGSPLATASFIGDIRMFGGPSNMVPAFWYLCYGQAVSRTTYSAAFAVFGTTYGTGDGSTTFNLPDCRGRVLVGLDNMGGTAANRITAGVSGIAGTTLGGAGGSQYSQTDTLTASSTSTATVTDPGHLHGFQRGQLGSGGDANPTWADTSFSGVATRDTLDAYTGISVAVATSTTVTSSLTGTSQNVQPAIMFNVIIYLGA